MGARSFFFFFCLSFLLPSYFLLALIGLQGGCALVHVAVGSVSIRTLGRQGMRKD